MLLGVICLLALLPFSLAGPPSLLPFPLSHKARSSPSPLPGSKPSSIESKGHTFSFCRDDLECQGSRTCRRWLPLTTLSARVCGKDWICLCVPNKLIQCTSTADCPADEACFKSFYHLHPICVWDVATDYSWLQPVPSPQPNITPSPSPQPPTGLSIEHCAKDSDCKGKRICMYRGLFLFVPPNHHTACSGREPCICVENRVCFGPSDCDVGELCAIIHTFGKALCASERAVGPGVKPIKFEGVPSGLNFDTCADTDDCQGTRICAQAMHFPELKECVGQRPCVCMPRSGINCDKSEDCDDGEVCSRNTRIAGLVCISKRMESSFSEFTEVAAGITPTPKSRPQASPSNSPKPGEKSASVEESCVDARALRLRGIEKAGLVYAKDVWAKVLCDEDENCATDGHVVVFRGVAMMMKSYCEMTECVEREMFVNSPRFRRGLRVRSNREDVEYTAFAARYWTRTEEMVLRIAVRFGL